MTSEDPPNDFAPDLIVSQKLSILSESVVEIKKVIITIDGRIGQIFDKMEDNKMEITKEVAAIDKKAALTANDLKNHSGSEKHHSTPCPFLDKVEKNIEKMDKVVDSVKKEGWQASTKILVTVIGILGSGFIGVLIWGLSKG